MDVGTVADGLVPPYGGRLVDARVRGTAAEELRRQAAALPRAELSELEAADLALLACGAYSPLDGFMDRSAYRGVVHEMRLPCGLPWTLPVVLRVPRDLASRLSPGDAVGLARRGQEPVGLLLVEDVFPVEPAQEARAVFGTDDPAHPGAAAVQRAPTWCLGGPVRLVASPGWPVFALTPAQTRQAFAQRGWRRVAAFQTRNPAHRAHEYLQKTALESVDGLLLHPLLGPTRPEDVPAPVRWRAYEILIHHYFPAHRVLLAAFPAAMRYGGPREAVFHALVRRNYGCSHFVVGRDHAGVGGFYGPYDAQRLLERLDPGLLGIQVLPFEAAFYCRRCGGMATERTCPHGPSRRVTLSGTEVRRRLREGRALPGEFTRPEVAGFLLRAAGKEGLARP